MYSSAIMAFLHYLAAFTLVSALAVEVMVFKPPLSFVTARRLQATDRIFGIAAGALLIVGALRVFYFEKGAAYYFGNAWFIAKLSLFILAGLISIYPTMLFLSWKQVLAAGTAPVVEPAQVRRARMCMMLELTAILGILLCAAFMARGLGYLH